MEKVRFENSRGKELVGNYYEAGSDAGTVMSHGFTGSKDQYGKFTEVAEDLHSEGFNVLTFDFSGCGESDDDSITVEKEVDDLNSAIDFLQDNGVEKLGLFGLSQGGWITLETYKERKEEVSCLVLLAPLTDAITNYREQKYSKKQRKQLQEDGHTTITKEKGNRDKYEIPGKLIDKKETLNQDELLESVDCPVLFIHGTEDDGVPIKQSEKAVEKLNSAELVKIEDDHYWRESVPEIVESSRWWFRNNIR
jgi:pimeloyl-ACP methyl ester carboxylesterase